MIGTTLLDLLVQLFVELLPRLIKNLVKKVRSIYRSSMGKEPMPPPKSAVKSRSRSN
jgi:hypothetical protein